MARAHPLAPTSRSAAWTASSGAATFGPCLCRSCTLGAPVSHEALPGPPCRYLESCSEAATLKRKCEFPANVATQKAGDKRKAVAGLGPHGTGDLAVRAAGGVVTWMPAVGSGVPEGLEPPSLPGQV